MPPFGVLTIVPLYGFTEQKTADSILQAARWRMVIFPYMMISNQEQICTEANLGETEAWMPTRAGSVLIRKPSSSY